MRDTLNNFAERLLERGINDEALSWLHSGDGKDSRTLGELATTAESIDLVKEAYAAGAERVIAAEIDHYPEGENTGKLVILLPESVEQRATVFQWAAEIVEQQGFDGTEDCGQDYLFVMVDGPLLPHNESRRLSEPVRPTADLPYRVGSERQNGQGRRPNHAPAHAESVLRGAAVWRKRQVHSDGRSQCPPGANP